MQVTKSFATRPNDRLLIEKEIEDTIHDILTDATNETALQHLASTIAVSDFRILRSDPVIKYWNVLKLQRTSGRNAMEQNINALNEVQKSCKSYNTRSQRRENENDEFYELDGMMLTGMKRSAGSILKTEAIKRAKTAKVYANLDKEQKNIVMLGLNSICDLSVKKETRAKKAKSLAYQRSPSHDDVADAHTRWARGTWFPNSNHNTPIIIPSDILC